jgi:hypothetical protein
MVLGRRRDPHRCDKSVTSLSQKTVIAAMEADSDYPRP